MLSRDNEMQACVERVILRVREHASRPFSLSEMADIAFMSPYHFNRVFRRVTGLPPRVFQMLLRLEAAKRLLASTEMSIVEVCFETGYTSVGTFTRRFTEMVGLPPNRFRRLAGQSPMGRGEPARPTGPPGCTVRGGSLTGAIELPAHFAGHVFVGAFPSPIPRGRPAGCAIMDATAGRFRIDGLPAANYYVSAVAVAHGAHGADAVLHDAALRGRYGPIGVRNDAVALRSPLLMRPAQVTDTPILLPLGILEANAVIAPQAVPFESRAAEPGVRFARTA